MVADSECSGGRTRTIQISIRCNSSFLPIIQFPRTVTISHLPMKYLEADTYKKKYKTKTKKKKKKKKIRRNLVEVGIIDIATIGFS